MITDLHIENIAIIEKADISFKSGLNVLTGETGAGKSIIIDSINAVLGNRISKDIVRHGSDYGVVSAVFIINRNLPWFNLNDIEQTDEIIIQRKISSDGKTSCRVNGMAVTATQLKELTDQLIDIHGQNDGQKLLDEKSHLQYLDLYGNLSNDLNNYLIEYSKLVSLFKDIKQLTLDNDEKERLLLSLHSTIDEIKKADIKDGEYNSLLSKLEILRNSEKIKDNLDNSIYLLNNSDKSIISMIEEVEHNFERTSSLIPDFDNLFINLKDSKITIKDIFETINDYRSKIDFSEEEYNMAENRKSSLDKLMKKYSTDENGLLDILTSSQAKLDDLQYSDDKLEKLKINYSKQKELVYTFAKELSLKRKEIALQLEKDIIHELCDLNMQSVRFKVFFDEEQKLTKHGIDNVKYVMSANVGEDLGRISKVASGGELSRIMLALKNVFSKNDSVDTMIFDEIDTGVSGISAQRVAEKLFSVSKNKQVMCVTHLPQIAAFADSQLMVRKDEINGRTYTEILELNLDDRKHEIARLYGGDNITDTTIAAAGEQLIKANEYKKGL